MQQRVWFSNSKGEKLSGLLFAPAAKKKYPTLVMCHGFTSSKYNKIPLARFLAAQKYAVLIFDAAGSGESQGVFEDHTVTTYVDDLHAAVTFLKKQSVVDSRRIAIIGHSLGGMIVVAYAAQHHDVNLVIPVDAPYHLLKDRRTNRFGNPAFMAAWKKNGFTTVAVRAKTTRIPKRLSYRFVVDARRYDLTKIVRKVNTPIVIVQGDADETVFPWHAERIFAAARMPKELIFVKGVNHHYRGKDEKTLAKIILNASKKYLSEK